MTVRTESDARGEKNSQKEERSKENATGRSVSGFNLATLAFGLGIADPEHPRSTLLELEGYVHQLGLGLVPQRLQHRLQMS